MTQTEQTDSPLSASRLEEIERRASAATPGPWASDHSGVWTMHADGCGGPVLDAHDWAQSPRNGIGTVGDDYPRGINHPSESMAFIAHARQDIPDLLAEVRRLQRERDNLRDLALSSYEMVPLREGELVQYLACYVTDWNDHGAPSCGFRQIDVDTLEVLLAPDASRTTLEGA